MDNRNKERAERLLSDAVNGSFYSAEGVARAEAKIKAAAVYADLYRTDVLEEASAQEDVPIPPAHDYGYPVTRPPYTISSSGSSQFENRDQVR